MNFTTLFRAFALYSFFLLWALAIVLPANAQTVLIDPSGDGGFENGSTFAANGWTVVNNASATSNNWMLNTGAPAGFSGTRAGYISNNSAATVPPYSYNNGTSSTVHLYRDVTFPAGETSISFSCRMIQEGELGWDRVLVYISNGTPSGAPVAGTPTSNTITLSGYTFLAVMPQSASWTNLNIPVTAAQAGNAAAASTRRILFVWQNDGGGGSGSAGIDNISLSSACVSAVAGLSTATLGSTTVTLSWNALSGATGYGVRYKRPSDPVTVSTWATPTNTAVPNLSIAGLLSSTGYEFQVAATGPAICNGFSASQSFTTACDGPVVTSVTPASRCTPGTLSLQAAVNAGSALRWYDLPVGGSIVGTTSPFTTPALAATTTYYAAPYAMGSGTPLALGAGALTTSGSGGSGGNYVSPFSHYFGGYKSQYIIRASELLNAGFTAGNFTSLAFDVTSTGTTYSSFQISIGSTALTTAPSTFVSSGLTPVYSGAPTPVVGINTYTFSTPFFWNGTSNIIINVCWSNNNTGGSASEVKYDATGFTAMAYYRADSQTPASICGTSSSTSTQSNRPRMIFGHAPICEGPRVPVTASVFPGTVIYVDSSATGTGTGISWTDAFTTLSQALALAHSATCVDSILVAKGTYYPTGLQNGTNKDSAFALLRGGLKLYGGYPTGGGIRNVVTHPARLSGNIGLAGDSTDNSYHVMVIAGIAAAADSIVVDGFTIAGGYASGSITKLFNGQAVEQRRGGGLVCWGNGLAKVHIRHCRFTGNSTSFNGGGMFNKDASPVISACVFSGNNGNFDGGGILNRENSSPLIVNCLFSGNTASNGGGMRSAFSSYPRVIHSTFAGNYAANSGNGGGIFSDNNASTAIVNSVIYGNNSGVAGAFTNSFSLIEGNAGGTNGNLNGNTQDPLFVSPVLPSTTPVAAGDYRLQPCSPALNAAANDSIPAGITSDLNSNARIFNMTADMGAYEYQGLPAVIPYDTLDVTICSGDSALFNTQWYHTAGLYTDTLSQVSGCDSMVTLRLTVNSRPLVTATPVSQSLCSGTATNIALSASIPGTILSWTVIQNGVTGASAGTGNNIAQTLTNTGTTSGRAVYMISSIVNSCPGALVSDTVTVTPLPVLTVNPATQSLCGNGTTNIALSAPQTGASFNWTATATGLTGATAGSGTTIAQALTLMAATAGTATYTITPMNGTCPGTTGTATVTVNPVPVAMATPASQTLCTGVTTGIALTSSVAGTTFAWTVLQTGVTGAAAGNGNNIAQILTNAGTTQGTVIYTITPTAGGCAGTPISVTITVNPKPSAVATPSVQTLCSGSTTNIALSSSTAGTTYSWTVAQTGVTGAAAGSGNTIVQTLSTTGPVTGTATYTITPSANGCPGNTTTVIITVNAVPSAPGTISGPDAPCAGSTQVYAVATVPGAGSYVWTLPPGWTGTSTTNSITVTVGNNNGTVEIRAANGCGNSAVTTKAVIATPVVTPTITIAHNAPALLCSGTAVTFTAAITGGGTLPGFQWKVNGNNMGSNSNSYTYMPDDGDTVTCTLISNAPCVTGNNILSNKLIMSVTPTVNPLLNILVAENHLCSDSMVVFLATPANGGTAPAYQWKLNNTNVGANSVNFTYMPADGDVVHCVMTSNAVCANPVIVESNPVPMTIIQTTYPSVSITATPGTNVANGQPVTFTAVPSGAGGMGYQVKWYRNNVFIPGITGNTWTAVAGTDIFHNTEVKAYLKSFSPCAIPDSAWSNGLKISIGTTGIDQRDWPEHFKLYPNPATGLVNIEGLKPDNELSLYDATGRIVLQRKITQTGITTIDMSQLAQGVYWIRFADAGNKPWQVTLTKQ